MLPHESEMDTWPRGPSIPPPLLPVFPPSPSPHTLDIMLPLHAWPDKSIVCVCMLFRHAVYTCIHIHISPLCPILMPGQTMSKGRPQILYGESVYTDKCVCVSECMWERECACLGGLGDVERTLANQSPHFSSRLAHRDLEFSRMAVSSQQHSYRSWHHTKS